MNTNNAFKREVTVIGTPPQYWLTCKGLQLMLQATTSVRTSQMLQVYAALAPERPSVKRKVPTMFAQESKVQRGPKGRLSDIHTSAQMAAYKQRSAFTDLLLTSFTNVAHLTDADKATFASHKIRPLAVKADAALENYTDELEFRQKWFELYANHAAPSKEAKQSAARLMFYPNTFWMPQTADSRSALLASFNELLEYNYTQYTDLCACNPSENTRRQFARLMFHPLRCTAATSSTAAVSVAQLCNEMDISLQPAELVSIGMHVARLYRAKHGREPTRRDTIVNGIQMKENVYTDTEQSAILACIQQQLLTSVVTTN